MGDYAKAESLFRQALAIRKDALGEKNADYASSLSELANLYREMGRYTEAEPLARQALEIHRQTVGEKHVSYSHSLTNLMLLYQDMGDYAKAEPLALQSLRIDKEIYGPQNPDYATNLQNLASLYDDMDDYVRAEPFYTQAIEIYKNSSGEKDPRYSDCLHNLAALYMNMRDFEKAEPLCSRVCEIWKESLGENHLDYAIDLDYLAEVNKELGNYARAEPLYQQALQIRKKTLGEKNFFYALSLNNLAGLYCLTGVYTKGEPLSRQAIQISRELLDQTSAVQSERQQEAMRMKVWHFLDIYLFLMALSKGPAEQAYSEVLDWKGEVGGRQQQIRRLHHRLALGGSREAARLETELSDTTRRLAELSRQTDLSTAERQSQETSLSDKFEQLQAALAGTSADFRKQLDQQHRSPDDLRKVLPVGAVLVDLVNYQSFIPSPEKGKPGVRQMELTAFVVRPGVPVERVELGPTEPIETAIAHWRRTIGSKTAADDPAAQLRQLLWKPLEKYVDGAKTVLISPNGLTAPLPWIALPGHQPGTYLIDDVAIALVPISRLLPELLADDGAEQQANKQPSLLLVGDVDFGADPGEHNLAMVGHLAARGGQQFDWPALPGTRDEVAAIQASFTHQFGDGVATELTRARATKSAVRAAAGKCEYLHFSTHGFFAPPKIKSAEADSAAAHDADAVRLTGGLSKVSGLDPGLLSGLVLAGANQRYVDGKDDGILTALEVSDIDLSHVKLATLSACETGLGKTAGNEGLLGLQRAFQTAGAKTVVASLWKVPDKATQLLMSRFYDNLWRKKMPKIEALREAQRWLLHDADKQTGLDRGLELEPVDVAAFPKSGGLPPYFWAAFVLSGDWR